MSAAISPLSPAAVAVHYEVKLLLDGGTVRYGTVTTRESGTIIAGRVLSISPVRIELGSQYGGVAVGEVIVRLANVTALGNIPSREDLEFSKLFDNSDGVQWLNRVLEIHLAVTASTGTVTRTLLFTGVITGVTILQGACIVTARSQAAARAGVVSGIQISAAIWPDAAPDALDKYVPIVLGAPVGAPPTGAPGPIPAYCIDVASKILAVASHQTRAGYNFNVWRSTDNGSTWSAAMVASRNHNNTAYAAAGAITTCVISSALAATDMWATDIDGIVDGVGGTLSNPIYLLYEVGLRYGGLVVGDFDATALNDAIYNTNVIDVLTAAHIIDAPISYLDFLAKLCGAFDIDLFFTRAGLIAPSYFIATAVAPAVYTDTRHIYGEPRLSFVTETGDGRRTLTNQIISRYRRNAVTSAFMAQLQTDDAVSQADLLRLYSVSEENAFIDSAGVMAKVNDHRLAFRASPAQLIEFDVSPEIVPDVDPTDIIGVTYFAGLNNAGGGWQAEPVYVESVEFSPDAMRAAIRAVRYGSLLLDAYLLHAEGDVYIAGGPLDGTVNLTIGSATVTKATGAFWSTLGVAQGNIMEIFTATNSYMGFVNTIPTDTTLTLNTLPDGSGADVTAPATESGLAAWRITRNWDQGAAEDRLYGGLAVHSLWTQTGAVSVDTALKTVLGAATAFISHGVVPGSVMHVDNGLAGSFWAFVVSVTSDSALTLDRFAGSTGAGLSFRIFKNGSALGTAPLVAGRKLR